MAFCLKMRANAGVLTTFDIVDQSMTLGTTANLVSVDSVKIAQRKSARCRFLFAFFFKLGNQRGCAFEKRVR